MFVTIWRCCRASIYVCLIIWCNKISRDIFEIELMGLVSLERFTIPVTFGFLFILFHCRLSATHPHLFLKWLRIEMCTYDAQTNDIGKSKIESGGGRSWRNRVPPSSIPCSWILCVCTEVTAFSPFVSDFARDLCTRTTYTHGPNNSSVFFGPTPRPPTARASALPVDTLTKRAARGFRGKRYWWRNDDAGYNVN